MRIRLVPLLSSGMALVAAHPSPGAPRRLDYQTDFDRVTVAVPADPTPAALDRRFLPPPLSDTAPVPSRRQTVLRIRGRGAAVRLRIPFG